MTNCYNKYLLLFYFFSIFSCTENQQSKSKSETVKSEESEFTYFLGIEDSSDLLIELDSFYIWSGNIRSQLKKQDSFLLSYGQSNHIFYLQDDTFYINEIGGKLKRYVRHEKHFALNSFSVIKYEISTCICDDYRIFRVPKLLININLDSLYIQNAIIGAKYNLDKEDGKLIKTVFNAFTLDSSMRVTYKDKNCEDKFDILSVSSESSFVKNKYYFHHNGSNDLNSRVLLDLLLPYLQYKYNIGFIDFSTPLYNIRTEVVQVVLK